MNLTIIILIIAILIGLFILYKILKPYILRYDTTILFTGGLGAGKTYSAVKLAITCLRKWRFRVKIYNKYKRPFFNFFYKKINKHRLKLILKYTKLKEQKKLDHKKTKKLKKIKEKGLIHLLEKAKTPQLYSNIPIHYKKSLFSNEKEWSYKLKPTHITLHEQIVEHSIVIIDELPQLVNQFNWNEELVKKNVNEFITFFRHYIDGNLLITGQSENDIVAQVRRKLNMAIWCFNIKFYLFKLIYSIRMCDILMSDNISNINTSFIEDNTKKKWGIGLTRKTYASRCYKNRYKNILVKNNDEQWNNLYTNEIIKIKKEISPIDDGTSKEFKENEYKKVIEMQNGAKK